MPDASRHDNGPRSWSEAFAALPLHAPGQTRWPAIASALDARRKPARRARWVALAAALFAVAIVPALWLRQERTAAFPSPQRVTTADRSQQASSPQVPTTAGDSASVGAASAATEERTTKRLAAEAVPTRIDAQRNSPSVASVSSRRDEPIDAPARDEPVDQRASRQQRNAIADAQTAIAQNTDALQSLYATSAQLEALLAMARDERVASGPAAALSGELDAQLASIDAQLAQPELTPAQMTDLWQARVDALQQVASFQTTQRWLSAQGERFDGALVSVD